MSVTINVTDPIYDKVYTIYAWQDNNRTLKLTQGEGVVVPDDATTVNAQRIKCPRFQLRDDKSVLDLSGVTTIHWAVTRPQGGEDLLTCNIVDATTGIVEIPITVSATEFAGEARGEIRVQSPNQSLVKFFGINACIGKGVSDQAAAQSSRFSALLDELNKVIALDEYGQVALDGLDANGELPVNGTNPVASGVLRTYISKYAKIADVGRVYVDTVAPPYYVANREFYKPGDVWVRVRESADQTNVSVLKNVSTEAKDALYTCTWESIAYNNIEVDALPTVRVGTLPSHAYTSAGALESSYPTYQNGDQLIVDGTVYTCRVSTPIRNNMFTYIYDFERTPTATDTYTKAEVDALISDVSSFGYEVVDELPDLADAQLNIIYLVLDETAAESDVYEQWLCVEDNGVRSWKQLGSTSIDLSQYATKEDLAQKAPVIIMDTNESYDTDFTTLAQSSLDTEFTVKAKQDGVTYPYLMLSQGANLLPTMDALYCSSAIDNTTITDIGTFNDVTIAFDGKTISLNGTSSGGVSGGFVIYMRLNDSNVIDILDNLAQGDDVTAGVLCTGTAASGGNLYLKHKLEGQNISTTQHFAGESKVSNTIQATAACNAIRISINVPPNSVFTNFTITPFMFVGTDVISISNPTFVNGWCDISNNVAEYDYLSTYPNYHKVGYKVDTKTYIDNQSTDVSGKMDYAPNVSGTSTSLHAGQAFMTDNTVGIKTAAAGTAGDKQAYTVEYIDDNFRKTFRSTYTPPCLCDDDDLFEIGDEWVCGNTETTSRKYTLQAIVDNTSVSGKYYYRWMLNVPAFAKINSDAPSSVQLSSNNYGGNIGSAYALPTDSYGMIIITPTDVRICKGISITANQNIYNANFTWESIGLTLKEDLTNKVTSLSSSSTNTQYPSAKCVYDLIEEKAGIKFEIVEEKPTTDIKTDVIYLVPLESGEESEGNSYGEWVYLIDGNDEGAWELIGTTNVDVSQFATKSELATKAPIIDVATDLSYDSDLAQMRAQSTDENLTVKVKSAISTNISTEYPYMMLSEGQNLMPTIASASSQGEINGITISIVDGVGVLVNGTCTATTRITLQSDGASSGKVAFKSPLSAGDSVTAGALCSGQSTISSAGVTIYYKLAETTSLYSSYTGEISGTGLVSGTMQSANGCSETTARLTFRSGDSFTNFLIVPIIFAGTDVTAIESPQFTSGWVDVSDDVDEYDYLSTYPNYHTVQYFSDTKQYIDDAIENIDISGLNKMDYAPAIVNTSDIVNVKKGQVFTTTDTVGVKTADAGSTGDKQVYTDDYVDDHFASLDDQVTSVSSSSTDTQFPSAKCVYDLFTSMAGVSFEVVQSKPVSDIKTNVIYLIPKSTAETDNIYDEWIYINNDWELIGSTSIDLSQYALESDIPTNVTDLLDDSDFLRSTQFAQQAINTSLAEQDLNITGKKVGEHFIGSGTEIYEVTQTGSWGCHINRLQQTRDKVTSLSSSSTDAQYPSAKCVYDALSNIPALDSYTKNQTNALLAEKAPVIEVETDAAYDSDLSVLKSQSIDNNLIVEAQQGTLGHPYLYLSQGANLLPPINSASSIGTVSGVTIEIVDGNTIKLNGTATAKINIWLKANNNNPMTMLQQVNQGDTATVGAMYRGTASGSSIQIVQRLDQADDTENIRNSKYIDFSEDKYSAELQTTADCPKCRICIIVPSGGSYTDFIITPFMFAGNSINVVENPVYTSGQLDISNTVSAYNYLSTYPNQHKVSYKIDTKTYVDNKEVDHEEVSELVDEGIADAMPTINNTINTNVNTAVNGKITYITPEQYGAKGNGNDDDTVALQACLDAANSSNYVLGLKRYKITSPIRICGTQNSGNNIHVELNRIDYTGNDFAVKIASRWGNIKIHRLESSGNGILIKDDNSGTAVKANNFAFDFIYSSGDCIKFESTKRDNIAYNTFNVPFLHSTNGNLINVNYATVENLFIGNRPECPNGWAIYHSNAYNTFMRFAFEYTLDICLGHGKFIDCRTTEGLNYYDWKGRESKFIKLTRTTTYGGREIADANTPVTFTGVDVSELSTFSEIMATLDDKIAEQDPDNPQKYFIGCQEIITYAPNIINNIARYDATNYEEILDGKMVIYWNKKAYVPNNGVLEEITTTPFVPLDTIKNNPTYFRIGIANCVINLNDSYCPVGIDSFIVEQTNSYKASVYNKDNILIFDGANEPAGKYKVSCYVTPLPSNIFDNLVNLPSYKKIHYAEKIKYLYTGTNEAWVVTPLQ